MYSTYRKTLRVIVYAFSFVFLSSFNITLIYTPSSAVLAATGGQSDTEPPTSMVTLSGSSNGQYYTSAVEVSISATDTPANLSRGIAYTAYRVNAGAWASYSQPFTISSEGTHTISYFSEDKDGNVEQVKTAQFQINMSAPPATNTPTTSQASTPTPTRTPTPTTTPTPTPTPTYSPSTITTTTSPTTTQLSPTPTPTPLWGLSSQSYPASYPYYRSPTKTPTPSPRSINQASSNRKERQEIPSPSITGELVPEAVTTKRTEPPNILGQWNQVTTPNTENQPKPWMFLIVVSGAVIGYIGFTLYMYKRLHK